VAEGLPYHVTQRGTNREKVFFSGADCRLYLRLIRENLCDAGAKVLAYCLMSTRVHFVVEAEREDSLALLFGRANGRYAQAVNIRKGRSGHLWQARFCSCPMSEGHLSLGA
jgi:REP element-mobilizing transposase RayT